MIANEIIKYLLYDKDYETVGFICINDYNEIYLVYDTNEKYLKVYPLTNNDIKGLYANKISNRYNGKECIISIFSNIIEFKNIEIRAIGETSMNFSDRFSKCLSKEDIKKILKDKEIC